ncbi:eukaryotic translation initiation factor 2B delta [Ascodesmis nigricans]|uniref:Translation initiation factor eIF2B subunit delta n=1 Tax=Ascodesmis nigricans TaxID=341454 RepID=A0A4S2N4Z7_9PEZI|nr:eukaryotic translation initiation factor 2B delta [Ascodesmis nigricans]
MPAKVVEKIVEVPAESKKDQGIIALLKELESEQFEKRKNKDSFGVEDAQNDVHPSIVTLGIQMNKGIIRGATARTMAMLACLRRVIDDYETPRDQTLIRHLPTSRYLSHQISFLTSARPMTGAMLPPAMGNSIRWLKTEISRINPDLSDDLAKRHLIDRIDAFIHEKFTAADAVIADIAQDYIDVEGSVVVTYSKSSIVQQVLLRAKELRKTFRVIVVDNRVTLEGRNLVHTLVEEDIEVEYVHTYALDHVLQDATVCLLGAQSVLADGSVCARAGTALTAAMAKRMNLPVIVCAEMVKFSDRVNIDQIVMNELGDPDALIPENWDTRFPEPGHLKGWQEQPNTMAVSLMYDVTPAELISSIICEHGSTCPTDVPGVTAIAAKRE